MPSGGSRAVPRAPTPRPARSRMPPPSAHLSRPQRGTARAPTSTSAGEGRGRQGQGPGHSACVSRRTGRAGHAGARRAGAVCCLRSRHRLPLRRRRGRGRPRIARRPLCCGRAVRPRAPDAVGRRALSLNDSKQHTAEAREELYPLVLRAAARSVIVSRCVRGSTGAGCTTQHGGAATPCGSGPRRAVCLVDGFKVPDSASSSARSSTATAGARR